MLARCSGYGLLLISVFVLFLGIPSQLMSQSRKILRFRVTRATSLRSGPDVKFYSIRTLSRGMIVICLAPLKKQPEGERPDPRGCGKNKKWLRALNWDEARGYVDKKYIRPLKKRVVLRPQARRARKDLPRWVLEQRKVRKLLFARRNAGRPGKQVSRSGRSGPHGRMERYRRREPSRSRRRIERVVSGGSVTSGFGYRVDPINGELAFHRGVDIAARKGQKVRAYQEGVVVFADRLGGYGRLVIIRHAGGFSTYYAHLRSILARKGRRVRRGSVIGAVGRSGRTTGAHLHFELRRNGLAIHPGF